MSDLTDPTSDFISYLRTPGPFKVEHSCLQSGCDFHTGLTAAGHVGPGSNGTAVNAVVVQRDPSASSHDVNNPGPYFDEQLAIPDDDRDLQHREHQLDDIKVKHHPKSGIPTKVFAFSDFTRHPAHHSLWTAPEPNTKPWRHFRSHLEFNIAEITLEAAIMTRRTISLIYTTTAHFGTAKGYPVVVHLANLPTHIHNSQGMGGGYIVGWLPVVKEDKAHAGKLAWANFKATVWHKSFERILSSLAAKTKTGQWLECLDVVQCWFFLLILILSSDFEEQSTMALTRGVRALWPCPVCLIPHNKLSDMLHHYPHHTSCDSQAILATTQERETTEEREEVLKEYGLHDVLCPLQVLWSDHLWVELQKYINGLRQEKMSQVDKSYQAFPHWQDQKHPNQVMNISFTDNSMHEDISKVLVIYHISGYRSEDPDLRSDPDPLDTSVVRSTDPIRFSFHFLFT
ncbi:hypothetical protein F4604DRAFT_1915011 [Suillus subluteus]|nr:hypothetical protein F4604DRAFT_1915011 [Suillus subluteus]